MSCVFPESEAPEEIKMSSVDLPGLGVEGGEMPREDTIRVICRFRPLNDQEERAGSKFVVKFPAGSEESCVSIAVSWIHFVHMLVTG